MSRKKNHYAVRIPHAVEGGLRSQQSSLSSTVWWGRDWLLLLERMQMGARLGRGRSYAQNGQVCELNIGHHSITAKVQGASSEPYSIEIAPVKNLTNDEIKQILNPLSMSRLYVNDLPFSLRFLLPSGIEDLQMNCTCHDWARPCKHLAAVLILFADIISSDPRRLLIWRGVNLPKPAEYKIAANGNFDETEDDFPIAQTDYWGKNDVEFSPPPVSHTRHDATALIKRLGPLPFWRAEEKFMETFETAYSRASTKANEFLENGFADFRSPSDKPVLKGETLRLKNFRLGYDSSF